MGLVVHITVTLLLYCALLLLTGTISREEKDWIRSVIRQRSGCGLPSDQTNEGESDTPEDTEAA